MYIAVFLLHYPTRDLQGRLVMFSQQSTFIAQTHARKRPCRRFKITQRQELYGLQPSKPRIRFL